MTDFPDYPAAHSMDTEWYAIDDEDNVGLFASVETGLVPRAVTMQFDELMEERIPALAAEWVLERFPPVQQHCLERGEVRDGAPTLLVLRTLADVPATLLGGEQFPDGQRIRVPTRSGSEAVLLTEMPALLYRQLHASGACLECFQPGWDFELGRHCYNYTAGYDHLMINRPYVREPDGRLGPLIPGDPFSLTTLPIELRDYFRRRLIRCPGLFAELESVQPLEFTACCEWGNRKGEPIPENFWWLAWWDHQTQSLRPIRGREQEYRDRFEELRQQAEVMGYAIEPPPDRP